MRTSAQHGTSPEQPTPNPHNAPSRTSRPPPASFLTAANLTEGQEMDITITISTNHRGRISLSLCPLDRAQADQPCFDTPSNKLRRWERGRRGGLPRAVRHCEWAQVGCWHWGACSKGAMALVPR